MASEGSEKLACGRLYGVGVGPGDPELLTLKARRVLQSVPLICVPQAETSKDSYALSIVQEFICHEKQEIVRFFFPTNDEKRAGDVWRKAAEMLAARLESGNDAAFITEGDPMLYSTFLYVLESVKANHPDLRVEVVPGVSSVMAAAASSGLPLAAHGQSLAVLPAAYGVEKLREAVASHDTVVLMKVNRTLLRALSDLVDLGLDRKAVYIKRASTDREQVVRDLRELDAEDLDYFSLLIIRNSD